MYNCFIFLQYKQRENQSSYLSKLTKMDNERFQSGGVKDRLINVRTTSYLK